MVRAPDRAAASIPAAVPSGRREQMRARYPDVEGFAERDGVRLFYEVYGHGEPTILLGVTEATLPIRSALRKVGVILRHIAKPDSDSTER